MVAAAIMDVGKLVLLTVWPNIAKYGGDLDLVHIYDFEIAKLTKFQKMRLRVIWISKRLLFLDYLTNFHIILCECQGINKEHVSDIELMSWHNPLRRHPPSVFSKSNSHFSDLHQMCEYVRLVL